MNETAKITMNENARRTMHENAKNENANPQWADGIQRPTRPRALGLRPRTQGNRQRAKDDTAKRTMGETTKRAMDENAKR